MVSIIIINYKQRDLLFQCVKSIFDKISSYPFEVIIINNSKEEDLRHINNNFKVRILVNENKGYSQANNLGSKYAKGDYLLFLNPDTIIQNDFLGNVMKAFQNIEFGAIGLKLYNVSNTFQISFGYHISILNEIRNSKLEKLNWEKDSEKLSRIADEFSDIKEIDWVSGAAILLKKEVFDLVNGFDERYFLYLEDSDLCKRITDKGFKIYFYPFSRIIHLKGKNTSKVFEKHSYYHSKESQLLYYKIHRGFVENVLIRLYLLSKFLILSITTFNKNYFKILLLIVKTISPLKFMGK